MSWTKERGAALERAYRTARAGVNAAMSANSLAGAANTALTNPAQFVASGLTPYMAGMSIATNAKNLWNNGKAAVQGVGKTVDNIRRIYNRNKTGSYEGNKEYSGTEYDQDHYKLSNQAKQKAKEITQDQVKNRILSALSQGVTDPTTHKFYTSLGGVLGGGGNNFGKLADTLRNQSASNQATRIGSMISFNNTY